MRRTAGREGGPYTRSAGENRGGAWFGAAVAARGPKRQTMLGLYQPGVGGLIVALVARSPGEEPEVTVGAGSSEGHAIKKWILERPLSAGALVTVRIVKALRCAPPCDVDIPRQPPPGKRAGLEHELENAQRNLKRSKEVLRQFRRAPNDWEPDPKRRPTRIVPQALRIRINREQPIEAGVPTGSTSFRARSSVCPNE